MVLFLFIFETIGTSELLLIGLVALIFLGPRRMPEMARKLGKIMADFRATTDQFKQTWEREVNFEEEAKALRFDDTDQKPVARNTSSLSSGTNEPVLSTIEQPEIKDIDPERLERLKASAETQAVSADETENDRTITAPTRSANDKRNWL